MKPLLPTLMVLLASPAVAEFPCDEFWFTRNLIMDRAGHCFTSPLGQEVFDNSDCSGRAVMLSRRDQDIIARIQEQEVEFVCNVDTSGTSALTINHIEARKRMRVLPLTDGYESGCIGYLGPELTMHAEPNAEAPVTGRIRTGADIIYSFQEIDGWLFMDAGVDGYGWFIPPAEIGPGICDMLAG